MLAVKLHQRRKPHLGRGSWLVPVISWRISGRQILRWAKDKTGEIGAALPEGKANYITLVQIPDDHPVQFGIGSRGSASLFWGWCSRPVEDWPPELKAYLASSTESGIWIKAPIVELGEALPSSCIKWTKDARLLYGSSKRRKRTTDE